MPDHIWAEEEDSDPTSGVFQAPAVATKSKSNAAFWSSAYVASNHRLGTACPSMWNTAEEVEANRVLATLLIQRALVSADRQGRAGQVTTTGEVVFGLVWDSVTPSRCSSLCHMPFLAAVANAALSLQTKAVLCMRQPVILIAAMGGSNSTWKSGCW